MPEGFCALILRNGADFGMKYFSGVGIWLATEASGFQLNCDGEARAPDWQIEYDASGQRTKRISADKTYEYIYAGGKLMQMKVGKDVLEFGYDADGKPLTMSLNGTVYYYITNLQGDVVSLENSELTIASYAYDAWGNMTAISGTYAELNPLRYRGYVYDQELGLYYLGSRYYDSAVGRFINADRAASTGQGIIGNNMFAYCGNNPTVRLDSDGEAFETIWDAVSLAASVADVAAKPYDPWAWAGLVGDVIDVAVPFVTGVGETTRAIKTIRSTVVNVITNSDDVVGTAKLYKKTSDMASDIKNATGTYVVLYKNGHNDVGKGGFGRAITSAEEHLTKGNKVSAIIWAPVKNARSASGNTRNAFVAEYFLQTVRRVGRNHPSTYNKIWSPGRTKF